MTRYLAFAAAAAIMLVATAWFLAPPSQEAFALLKVSSKTPTVLDKNGNSNGDDFAIFKRTQAQLVRSGAVVRRAVADPAIRDLPMIQAHSDDAAWLSSRLEVTFPDDSEIMRVALKGPDADELVKIVDMVAKKYLTEIVQHQRDLHLEQESKLEKKYHDFMAELTKQTDVLHAMEQASKTGGSESARVREKLAMAELDEAIATRGNLKRRLSENEMQIMLLRARAETPAATRTSGISLTDQDTSSSELTLPLLELQKAYLEKRVEEAEKDIEERAKRLERANAFSSQVAAKHEELAALKAITARLREELDRARVERMAQERITKVDDAVVASSSGEVARRYAALAGAAIASLGLVAVGLLAGRSRQS